MLKVHTIEVSETRKKRALIRENFSRSWVKSKRGDNQPQAGVNHLMVPSFACSLSSGIKKPPFRGAEKMVVVRL